MGVPETIGFEVTDAYLREPVAWPRRNWIAMPAAACESAAMPENHFGEAVAASY
ncbi:MAG: hypothetical protein K0S88_1389, partial [Actinomycetia bacterium]|nr:hypothetical protein [Actinomycetes bacterium]